MKGDIVPSADVLFIYGAVERIRRVLGSDVYQEIKSQPTCLVKDDLQNLDISLSRFCLALWYIYNKIRNTTKAWHELQALTTLKDLMALLYVVEDMLDVVATEHLELKANNHDRPLTWHQLLPPPPDFPALLGRMCAILDGILDDLVARHKITTTRLEERSTMFPAFLTNTTMATNAISKYGQLWPWEDKIFGRESEKEQITDYILSSSCQEHPIVLFVTGARGMGKTTLGKVVCNDPRVSDSFDLVLWPFLPRSGYSFNRVERVMVEIIRSLTRETLFNWQKLSMVWLKDRVQGLLQGKKFLIVLDGNAPLETWDLPKLRDIFNVGSKGSTVMVISIWWSSFEKEKEFKLAGLTEDESWSLFTRYGFDEKPEQEYPFLMEIGMSIVDKCYGFPLALKTLGSTLSINRNEDSWKQINESIFWGDSVNEATDALRISIEEMPFDLMQCFIGSAVYLEDKFMSRDQLIYCWMAHGLLQCSEANGDLRYKGDIFCNELLSRTFLRSYQSDCPRNDIIGLRPEVADFARTLIGGKAEFFAYGRCRVSANVRHLLYKENKEIPLDEKFSWERLTRTKARTFLFKDYIGYISKPFLERLISALSHAHVILLDHSEFEELPDSIGNLKLLRYLSLAGNRKLQVIPDSIGKLVNLQTLDLSDCEQLPTLPSNMGKLVGLRHLLLSVDLMGLPEEVLKSWTSLHLLKICYCRNLISLPDAIAQLTALRVLRIHDCPSIASLPSSIKCLTNLEELSILDCKILDLTGWDGLDGLRALQFLQLQGIPKLCEFPKGLLSTGGSLRHLVVSNCENLKALPECLKECNNLLELVIDKCPNVFTLPRGIHTINSLQVLKILNCPELVARCALGKGEDWHLISHISKIQLQQEVIQNKATSTLKTHPGNIKPKYSVTGKPFGKFPRPPRPHRRSRDIHRCKCKAFAIHDSTINDPWDTTLFFDKYVGGGNQLLGSHSQGKRGHPADGGELPSLDKGPKCLRHGPPN